MYVDVKDFWLKAACLSVAPFLVLSMIYSSSLGAISAAFPETPTYIVQSIQTITYIGAAVVALLYGRICRRLSLRRIAILGLSISFVASIFPVFGGGMEVILACRAVCGIGQGLMYPVVVDAIAAFFSGSEREAMVGYKGTVANATAILFAMIGGWLATFSWRYCFLGYLILLIPSAIILWKFPKDKAPKAKTDEPAKAKISIKAWLLLVWNVVFQLFQLTWTLNVSIVVAQASFGTSVDSGLAISISTGMAALAGIVYPYVKKAFKNFTFVFVFALYSIDFVLLSSAQSIEWFWMAGFFNGFAWGTYCAEFVMSLIRASDAESVSTAMGYYTASMKIGQFFAPLVLATLIAGLGLNVSQAPFMIAATFFLASTAGALAITLMAGWRARRISKSEY